jgi:phage pi2 protein 07
MNNFKDLNFKISVIGTLHDLGYYNEAAEEIRNQNSDWDEDHRPIPAVLDFYKNLDINPEYLSKIENFHPDGGDLCYEYLFNVWDGEDEQFDISSIEGIENLVKLKKFDPISMISNKGIDFFPLLKCEKLKIVSTEFMKKDFENIEVLKQLEARGVKIK